MCVSGGRTGPISHRSHRDPCRSPRLFPACRSLYSVHVGPGPCHRPSKERLITGKKRISVFAVVANPLCVCLSFLLSTTITNFQPLPRPSIFFLFISLSSSTPRLYFLLRRVRFKKHHATGFTFTNTRLLPQGWILKARRRHKGPN